MCFAWRHFRNERGRSDSSYVEPVFAHAVQYLLLTIHNCVLVNNREECMFLSFWSLQYQYHLLPVAFINPCLSLQHCMFPIELMRCWVEHHLWAILASPYLSQSLFFFVPRGKLTANQFCQQCVLCCWTIIAPLCHSDYRCKAQINTFFMMGLPKLPHLNILLIKKLIAEEFCCYKFWYCWLVPCTPNMRRSTNEIIRKLINTWFAWYRSFIQLI